MIYSKKLKIKIKIKIKKIYERFKNFIKKYYFKNYYLFSCNNYFKKVKLKKKE
jgi:hypothetical protein